MRKLPSRRRGRAASVGLAVLGVAGAALPFLAAPSATALTGTTGPVSVDITPTAGLADGQNISITGTGTGGSQLYEIKAHICAPGAGISNSFDFSFSGPYCVPTTAVLGTGDREKVGTYGPAPTGTITFKAGIGTTTWTDSNPLGAASHTLTCDPSNPCDLVVQFQSTAAGGPFFFTAPITYAGPASAPLTPAATAGDTTATVSWTAPASNGNSTIDNYQITPFDVTTSTALAPIVTPTAGLSSTLPAGTLTNFHQYTFTVKAHNAAGFGAASVASNAVTPGPNPPTGVSALPGDHSASVSWTAPSNTAGLDSYRINAYAGPGFVAPPAATFDTTGTPLTATIGGLTNGTAYKFTVQGHYGASGFGPESALSGTVTPNGTFVTQVITAVRPTGTLEIAEACANGTGSVPAGTGPQFGSYPQTCTVPLGTATLNAAATYYVATGAIQTVSVRDLRDADVGWNVNAQISNFTTASDSFSGNCLAFTPAATGLGGPAGYTQVIAAGASSDGLCGATGLTNATTVMTGGTLPHPNTGGLGRADLTGPLTLNIPVTADAGTYSATLTFTVI